VINLENMGRDLSGLVVPRLGRLVSTGDEWEPYRLLDADDALVDPVAVFLHELVAAGKSVTTLRSYGMDLLRWWRFLHAVGITWDRASRVTVVPRSVYEFEDLEWAVHGSGCPAGCFGDVASAE
jgi:hypothetical protein